MLLSGTSSACRIREARIHAPGGVHFPRAGFDVNEDKIAFVLLGVYVRANISIVYLVATTGKLFFGIAGLAYRHNMVPPGKKAIVTRLLSVTV